MMKFDRDLIGHLERLARIELSDDEREKLSGQLEAIVEFVEKLQSVDTSGVEATRLIDHLDEERTREDEPVAGLHSEDVMERAPDAADGYFRVPRVIDRGDNP
jgi:aspartyl-tRNA(Asn)/glutamyl-tRNA(Gln) amidotransferase subunit C